MDQEMISRNADETVSLGEQFAQEHLSSGSLVVLRGELGAGKTQFTKGIGKFFGIDADEISSPTYTLVNEFDVASGTITKMFHLDCYRFEKPEELLELGVEEYLYPKHGVTIIEWPERIESYLPERRIEVVIEVLSLNERKIAITNLRHG
jgi:tRNA threonylcarbamoyladenosine biosynthesis protein TsaE